MIELTTQHYLYIYAFLVLFSIIYLYFYRRNLVKQAANKTKRNQAIEKFKSYTRAITTNTNKNTNTNTNKNTNTNTNTNTTIKEGFKSKNNYTKMPSSSKSAALGARCIPGNNGQSSAVPEMPPIPEDEFLIPELSEMIRNRVNIQTLKLGQDLIINNIIQAFTRDVIIYARDILTDLQKIILAATPTNEFTQEERLEQYFNKIDEQITGFIRTKLEYRLNTAFEQSQILSSNESQVRELVIREIKERVFAQLYNESRRLQDEICRTQSELAQKIESASASEIRFKLQTAQIQHRQILQSLVLLTETSATKDAIRAELAQLTDTVIQPAMETDLDTINSRRLGRLGMPLGESEKHESALITNAIEQVPSHNAYKAYLDAAARRESEFKIDPVSALDKMERSTIGFLEQLGVELGMSNNSSSAKYSIDQANTTLSTPSINRFASGQPSNLGSWMTNKNKNTTKNKVQQSPSREGFATSEKTNLLSDSQEGTELGQQITGWSRYVYDFIKTNFDSEITAQAERILTDENNMVPIGILLILGSILLYFIDLSS